MSTYVVAVGTSRPAWLPKWPAWIHVNPETNLPCFTFDKPEGVSLSDAEALKARAEICCGGTLSIVEADA